jgi:NAD(P)-dependent dehydrogenase (short-subunit alcohol dehydrogenase family)
MANQAEQKVWFITGCSTGFGRILAEQLLAAGARVIATARKPESLKDLAAKYPDTAQTLALDVTQQASIDAAVKEALARFGRVDVLVNNAGYGVNGAIEEVTPEEYMPMYETNVFGLFRMTQALLPQFRKQRSGNIVMLSSIAGLVGSPGWGLYASTKFAVEGFSEALAGELAPLGVYVTLVEPGPFRTDFLGRSGVQAKKQIEDYEPAVAPARAFFANMAHKQPGDPAKACEAIVQAVNSAKPPVHLVLGKTALERFRGKLAQFQAEMAEWEEVTLATDFPPGT